MAHTLTVHELTKAYRTTGRMQLAVDRVCFQARRGEILGILGPNGSGKTTTLKAIAGLTTADSGRVHVEGLDIGTHRNAVMFRIGVVLEGARNVYWRMSIVENLLYFAGIKGVPPRVAIPRANDLLGILELDAFRDTEVRKLSKGNQQKVAVACAAMHRPALMLLDEPTLGLDVAIVRTLQAWIRQLAREGRHTLLITSHDLDFIEAVCDRVVILCAGQVVLEDSVAGLRRRYRPLRTLSLSITDSPGVKLRAELHRIGLYARLTASEHLRYFARLRGMPASRIEQRITEISALLGLGPLAHRRVSGFSQGERMKVALGQALIHDPVHLLLDEPTSGLDVPAVRGLRDLLASLRDAGTCIVFSSHVLGEVEELCDRIVVMGRGRVVGEGTLEELRELTGTSTLEQAFLALTAPEVASC